MAGAPTWPSWPGAVCYVQGESLKVADLSLAQVLNSRLPGPRPGNGCQKPQARVSVMYRERMSGADPQGSAQSAIAASSGKETTFELIDPPSADHSQIPKTPFELVAAIAIVRAVAA